MSWQLNWAIVFLSQIDLHTPTSSCFTHRLDVVTSVSEAGGGLLVRTHTPSGRDEEILSMEVKHSTSGRERVLMVWIHPTPAQRRSRNLQLRVGGHLPRPAGESGQRRERRGVWGEKIHSLRERGAREKTTPAPSRRSVNDVFSSFVPVMTATTEQMCPELLLLRLRVGSSDEVIHLGPGLVFSAVLVPT